MHGAHASSAHAGASARNTSGAKLGRSQSKITDHSKRSSLEENRNSLSKRSASKLIDPDDVDLGDWGEVDERFCDPNDPLSEHSLELIKLKLGLTAEQVQKCDKLFKKFDGDNSGQLDLQEARKLMIELGDDTTDEEFAEHIKTVDTDASGLIDFPELLVMFSKSPGQLCSSLDTMIDAMADAGRTRMGGERATLEERVTEGVPKGVVLDYLRSEISEAQACLQLPESALLFTIFVIFFILQDRTFVVHTVETSIDFDLKENANFAFGGNVPFDNGRMGHKSFEMVNTIADFWSWMNMGLIPLVFREEWDVNEVRANTLARCAEVNAALASWGFPQAGSRLLQELLPCPEQSPEVIEKGSQSMYLLYNRIIGGLRLVQQRVEAEDCLTTDIPDSAYGRPCYPSRYDLDPDYKTGLVPTQNEIDSPGGETTWLLSPNSQETIRKRLRELENQHWVSEATAKIEVSFVSYNAIEGTLTMTYIQVFFTRGGHFWKQVVQFSLTHSLARSGWAVYACLGLWALISLKLLFAEVMDIMQHCWQLGLFVGIKTYIAFWNVVDWLSISISFTLILLLFLIDSWTQDVLDVLETMDPSIEGGWSELAILNNVVADIETLGFTSRRLRLGFFVYPFLLASRLFKSFVAQPRLAVMTKTLGEAFTDIFHFGIVLFTVFMTYAAGAVCLFGREMMEFCTLERAVNSSLRCLFGDFDWRTMKEVGFEEATIWFWTFNVLILHIMFNMLLSIIMDMYMQVKAQATNTETIWSQMIEIHERWKLQRKGESLSLQTVLDVLDPTSLQIGDEEGEDELMFIKDLVDQVKGLNPSQAADILQGAVQKLEADNTENSSMSDAMQKIQVIDNYMNMIHWALGELVNLRTMMASRESQAILNTPKDQASRETQALGKAGGGPAKDDVGMSAASLGSSPERGNVTVPPEVLEDGIKKLRPLTVEVTNRFEALSAAHVELHNAVDELISRVVVLEAQMKDFDSPLQAMEKPNGSGMHMCSIGKGCLNQNKEVLYTAPR